MNRDPVYKFESIFNQINKVNPITFPLDNTNKELLKDKWNELSNEHMIGIFHGFIILRPYIKKALQQLSKIELAKQSILLSENHSDLFKNLT